MGRLRVVYAINEQRKSKDIGEKYELLEATWSESGIFRKKVGTLPGKFAERVR